MYVIKVQIIIYKHEEKIDSLNGELSSLIGKKLKRYSIITNKNQCTFHESFTSIMSLTHRIMIYDLRRPWVQIIDSNEITKQCRP